MLNIFFCNNHFSDAVILWNFIHNIQHIFFQNSTKSSGSCMFLQRHIGNGFQCTVGKTGYMSSVRNTTAPAAEWIAGGVPITMMMNMERRHGEMKPVIQKALVKLDGAPFKAFAAQRDRWAVETDYVYPGPIQYFGPTEVCDQATKTLQLEQAK